MHQILITCVIKNILLLTLSLRDSIGSMHHTSLSHILLGVTEASGARGNFRFISDIVLRFRGFLVTSLQALIVLDEESIGN